MNKLQSPFGAPYAKGVTAGTSSEEDAFPREARNALGLGKAEMPWSHGLPSVSGSKKTKPPKINVPTSVNNGVPSWGSNGYQRQNAWGN